MPHLHRVKLLLGALPPQHALQLMPAGGSSSRGAKDCMAVGSLGGPRKLCMAHLAGRWQEPGQGRGQGG